eukprot:10635828-Heterocapsa_arctica.AAC.1
MCSSPRSCNQAHGCTSDLGAKRHGGQDAHRDQGPDLATSPPEGSDLVDPFDDLPEPLQPNMAANDLASSEIHAQVPRLPYPAGVKVG